MTSQTNRVDKCRQLFVECHLTDQLFIQLCCFQYSTMQYTMQCNTIQCNIIIQYNHSTASFTQHKKSLTNENDWVTSINLHKYALK